MGDHVLRGSLPRATGNSDNLRIVFFPQRARKVQKRTRGVRSLNDGNTERDIDFAIDQNPSSTPADSVTHIIVAILRRAAKGNK